MLKSIKLAWPVITRSVKRPVSILPRQTIRFQPLRIYRPFTTTVLDNSPLHTQYDDSLWTKYLDQISHQDNITEQDFIDICKYTQANQDLKGSEKIKRFQHILRDIHSHLDKQPELKSAFQRACNMLMHIYIVQGDLKSAKLVFEGLVNSDIEINPISIRTIMHGIQTHSTRTDLYKFVQSLEKRNLFPKDTSSVYISILYALKHFRDIRGCQFYFAEMIQHGLDNDESSYKVMMQVYRQANRPESVLELFNTMKEKKIEITVPVYNIVLSALSTDSAYRSEMENVYKELKESGQSYTSSTYLTMKIDPLEAIEDMKKSNIMLAIRDYNEYFVHYVKKNKFNEALKVYKLMKDDKNVKMDVYSYSIVMDVLSKDTESSPESVFELYQEMKNNQIQPDAIVFTLLLTACKRKQDLERGMSLLEEMEQYEVKPNEYTFNSILGILSTMEGASMIDLDRASLIWEKMTSMGIHPDTRTYNTYLSIISKLIKPIQYDQEQIDNMDDTLFDEEENVPKTVREMLRMYRYMRRNHHQTIQPDFATYSIVINSLSAAGQLRSAMQVYSDAKMSRVTLPVSSCNEIMRALQRGGKMSEAMNVWYDMKIYGILPDNITYEIILETCEQLGLSDSLTSIRNQRKLDMNRLLELDSKKEKRMKKPL